MSQSETRSSPPDARPRSYSRQRRVMPVTRNGDDRRCTPRTARSYFIVDAHIALWDARPENQRNIHGKQFIDCFYDYHRNLSPESEVWPYEDYLYQGGERLMKDLFTDGYVDHAIFQPAYLGEFYHRGFGQTEEASALAKAHPDKLTYNHNFDPRNGEAGPRAAARRRRAVRADRASSSTPPSGTGTPAARSSTTRGRCRYFEACRELGITQHPRAQGPDDPAAGPGRVRRRRHRPRRHRTSPT